MHSNALNFHSCFNQQTPRTHSGAFAHQELVFGIATGYPPTRRAGRSLDRRDQVQGLDRCALPKSCHDARVASCFSTHSLHCHFLRLLSLRNLLNKRKLILSCFTADLGSRIHNLFHTINITHQLNHLHKH